MLLSEGGLGLIRDPEEFGSRQGLLPIVLACAARQETSLDRGEARAIEWDCNQLLISFYNLLDQKDYGALADLFAEDGAWVRLGQELKGRHAIMEAMREREDWLTTHIVSNIQIKIVDPDTAETSQYVTLYRIEGHQPSKGPAAVAPPMGILHHRDTLVRRDGQWKFKRKTSRAVMVNRERVTHYDKR